MPTKKALEDINPCMHLLHLSDTVKIFFFGFGLFYFEY